MKSENCIPPRVKVRGDNKNKKKILILTISITTEVNLVRNFNIHVDAASYAS